MSMNKIILLGHPSSGLQQVESLLLASGMQPALPSKRDGLLPAAVVDTLCQAHQCPAIEDAMTEDEFSPVQAGAIWQSLALDLVLGNLQQSLWGWADVRNIFWLDYWVTLDPHVTFVMVYDQPGNALQAAAWKQTGQPVDMELPRFLENWQAYNGAMLRFYSRHPDRCLLVNTRYASEQLLNYLEQLGTKLHGVAPQLLAYDAETTPAETFESAVPGEYDPQTLSLAISQGQGSSGMLKQWFSTKNPLELHLLQQILQDYPSAEQIYQELEAAATVQHLPSDSVTVNPADAWITLTEQRQAMMSLTLNLYEQLREHQRLQVCLNNQLAIENQQSNDARAKLEESLSSVQRLEKEKFELHIKLQKTSEDREKKLKENKDLAEAKDRALAKVQELQQQVRQSQSAELTEPKIKELEEENDLILTQLHQVQEELERYYLENQELKKKLPQPQTKPYGAAQRIQKRLSYRLGAVMIANSRSLTGWFRMPFALASEARAYRADKHARGDQKLPPIHTYADASDAERYKKHLSYRLGEVFIKHGKTPWGWLVLPFAIRGTLKNFKEGRV